MPRVERKVKRKEGRSRKATEAAAVGANLPRFLLEKDEKNIRPFPAVTLNSV